MQTNSDISDSKGQRSASYPSVTVDEAILFAEKIYKNFSLNTSVTREEAATVLKMHPGSISRDFGACTQYGLFEKSADGYKLTKLFDSIINPENQKEKKIARLIAFGNPKLFRELLEKFDGHVIPQELPNTLIKHHNITAKAAPAATETFLQSGIEVGVINENRVLRYKDTLSATQKVQQYAEVYEGESDPKNETNEAVKDNVQIIHNSSSISFPNEEGLKKVPIHLTKNKEAYFAYPANMSANDVKLVEHQLQGILMRIQFENEESKNPAGGGI